MHGLALDGMQTLLCIGAHADDIEIGCGGTVRRLIEANPQLSVHWMVLSGRGERGREAEASARQFVGPESAVDLVLRDYEDSFFPYAGRELKDEFHRLADRVSPDLIFTHRREDLHQDHRLVSELTHCAFRDHMILEYEIPKYDGDLGQPNVFVPLDEAAAERKVDSILAAFPSQHSRTWFDADTFRALLRIRGVESNAPGGFAEGFHCRKMTLRLG